MCFLFAELVCVCVLVLDRVKSESKATYVCAHILHTHRTNAASQQRPHAYENYVSGNL